MGFDQDLKRGRKWESRVCDFLNRNGIRCSLTQGKNNVDIISDDGSLKFEVKFDEMTLKTGNIAIEVGTKTKPTGLSTSQADYWVHIWYSGPHLYYNVIGVQALRNLIKANLKNIKIVHEAGDGNATVCLVPKAIFAHWGVCYPMPGQPITISQ